MNQKARSSPALVATLVGLASLASAMGVGRFAFTPVLPLMQANGSVSVAQGAGLAAANYIGYFIGALACGLLAPAPHRVARLGLVAVAAFTLAMGIDSDMTVWYALRFGAGMASACVLVGVSAWALTILAGSQRSGQAGWVFAGVGVGIALAGLVGLIAGLRHVDPAHVWLALGAASALVAVCAWMPLRPVAIAAFAPSDTPRELRSISWRLVLAYGTFGFGYIIPATFLPAMARAQIDDPAVFGWVWPVFGVAAAVSTALTAFRFHRLAPRRLWMLAQGVLAAGVLAPVLSQHAAALLVSAVCVGGTFMVITMAGMQEARRVAGAAAPRLMALMTSAFALGQIAGPFTVALGSTASTGGMRLPSLIAVIVLLAGMWALRDVLPEAASPSVITERNSA